MQKCANPNCDDYINSSILPKHIIYCGFCQAKLIELRKIFPESEKEERIYLLEHFEISQALAVKLLNTHVKSFKKKLYSIGSRSRKENRAVFVLTRDVEALGQINNELISLSKAAEILDINKWRVKFLAKKRLFPTRRLGKLRKVRLSDLNLIIMADEKAKRSEKIRKRNSLRKYLSKKEMSANEAAGLIGIDSSKLVYHIRKGRLCAKRKKAGTKIRWVITESSLIDFCKKVLTEKNFKNQTKIGAQQFLSSKGIC